MLKVSNIIDVPTCSQPHFQLCNNVTCSLGAKRILKFFFFIILVKNEICPPFCPDIYKPVCGSNNVTYPNLCRLRFADCEFENDEKITLKHEGPCERKGIKIKCPYLQKKVFSVNVDAGLPIKLMEKPLVIVCGI